MKIVWITTRPWLAVAVLLLGGVDSHKNGIGNLREAMPREHLGTNRVIWVRWPPML